MRLSVFSHTFFAVGLILVVGMAVENSAGAPAGSRDTDWKKVDEAMQKGLPKTAIDALQPIIEGALKEKAYPEAIKAIGRKIAMEGQIQGNKPEERLSRLADEIAKAPKEMLPVLTAIQANWYWNYFQQNRWRFMQRTATAESPGKDITTWDLPRIYAEIDKKFTKALSYADELKTTPIASYDALLEKGTMPDSYRPTLYDFLVHDALTFYSSAEQAGARPEDAFELSADSPIFGSVDEFLAWDIKATDENSVTVEALRLYQYLLKFHKTDKDPSALPDADLDRLSFGYNHAFGEEKNARYKAALKKFAEANAPHELSAMARAKWAGVLQSEGSLVDARDVALQGEKAFPGSNGGKLCHNIVAQIESKNAQVITERVWNEPWPTLDVSYRNITDIHFRAVKIDWVEAIKSNRNRPEWLDQNGRRELLAKKPALEWSGKLPATEDYQERVERLPAPKELKAGFYLIIASPNPKFTEQDNQISFSNVWVSTLAIVMRTQRQEGKIEGFVLDANFGEPVADAEIKTWIRENNNQMSDGPAGKTDKNGMFSFDGPNQRSCVLLATKDGQQLSTNDLYLYHYDLTPRATSQTIFFTDRGLYRPGQMIQYKGICIQIDQQKNNYSAIANRAVTVIFQDPNGKEITRQHAKSNDYGSFSGSFTAPRDRLAGNMTIRTEAEPLGATNIHVEEYKRPKFQVTLDAPKEAPKLNGVVSLQGKGTAYNGAAVGDAKVTYRVVREVRYPIWWGYYYWWRQPNANNQEIAHGTAITAPDGSFTIEFTAKPDLSVAEKDEPTFHYEISADVTDTSGETRSASRGVAVGYTALQASVTADEWQTEDKPVEIKITTQSLDGEGQKAEGTIKIYKLRQPDKVQRPDITQINRPMPVFRRGKGGSAVVAEPRPDPSNIISWPLGEMVQQRGFTTDSSGKATMQFHLPAGPYRVLLDTQDRFHKPVTAKAPLQVLKPDAKQFPIKIPDFVGAPKWSLEPNEEFTALWGTGYEKARAYIEIEHRHKIIKSFWTEPGATQQPIKQAVDEEMRGGFTVHVTMVRENRAYLQSRHVDVPWSNKKLTVKWEHFVSKLEPAQKESWNATITGPDAKKAVAEMVAALYDQSLDAYVPHAWQTTFNVFYQDRSNMQLQFENSAQYLQHMLGNWTVDYKSVDITYRHFPADIVSPFDGMYAFGAPGRMMLRGEGMESLKGMAMDRAAAEQAVLAPTAARAVPGQDAAKSMNGRRMALAEGKPGAGFTPPGGAERPDLSKVSARQNLNETAFFFPHLISDTDGEVKMEFTMPEALTQWRFMGFVHDAKLRSGYLEDKVVTAKDLMIQPNPPRFVREGDVIEFTVKVSNQSDKKQTGGVRLTFTDARTAKSVDEALDNSVRDQKFSIAAKESKSFSWKLTIPDGLGPLAYKAVGATDRISDGEEGLLPVLSRRVLVTESMALPIRDAGTKHFDFVKLRQSAGSKTLKNESLTVQMVSNPSWYAVLALPFLMESQYECSEQVFNRLYANSLARHIANSDPKIRRIFDQWKNTPALDSPLEKNQELKSVILEETPWLQAANRESQARRNVGILFDDNRLNDETQRLLKKLSEMQMGDGAWPWFPGGPANDYMTLYITTGFGRLRHLGLKLDMAPALKSLDRLDNWIETIYRDILAHDHKDDNHLSSLIALYLYGRSFFLEDKPIAPQHRASIDYFLGQAKKYWLKLDCRQSQGHLALALKRFADKQTAVDIMKSLKERSVTDEEMGMFWRDTEYSFFWYRAPIETQALMIEAFEEVMNDDESVENCKVWLLKQKQTQDWKTTKGTADAVYALLLRGGNWLASDALVDIKLGSVDIKPEKVEAGTGFFEQKFLRAEVSPQMSRITLTKSDPGVAWGSVHWQYLEDMSKITPHEGTPLKLTKTLFRRELTKSGPVLEPIKGPLAVGDEVVVRVNLHTDRDMEYVHLKDYRGSGTEPTNVLSQYKYQDGLGYYESTKDTASHFFIDYLPKGAYVFEYAVRVQLRGEYQTGYANIQCMYAPEFNSHSESIPLDVK
jgi:Bacterial Alpha-2-macroglobulin MG10 domain/Alpha-2-macroglobulin family/MG2 domain